MCRNSGIFLPSRFLSDLLTKRNDSARKKIKQILLNKIVQRGKKEQARNLKQVHLRNSTNFDRLTKASIRANAHAMSIITPNSNETKLTMDPGTERQSMLSLDS